MEYLLDTKVSSRGGHVIKKSISRNTASAYWNVFKQVLTKAYRERRLTDDLASLLENISCTTPVKQSLTLEEVRRMYSTECSVPVVRKAALFSCLTGLRISDILRLKWENIRSYADGGYYLDFICVKTKCQTQVPIGDDAYALIHPKNNRTYIFQGFQTYYDVWCDAELAKRVRYRKSISPSTVSVIRMPRCSSNLVQTSIPFSICSTIRMSARHRSTLPTQTQKHVRQQAELR